jgi:hypothetical protein
MSSKENAMRRTNDFSSAPSLISNLSNLLFRHARAGIAMLALPAIFCMLMATGCGSSASKIAVSPTTASLYGGATQQFTATVTNSSSTAVTWSVAGGGSISSSGLYTAPATISSSTTATVTATLTSKTGVTGSAAVTLRPPVVTVLPGTAALDASGTQQFTATVTGSSSSAVTWSVSASSTGSIDADGLYTAPAKASASATDTVIATLASNTAITGKATITFNPVAVTVTPQTPTLGLLDTEQFSASVTGTWDSSVTWGVSGTDCSGLGCGYVDSTGFYHAPWCMTTSESVTITATSAADPTKSGSTNVTLEPAGPVLDGQYAFLFQGVVNDDYQVLSAGTLTADGSGNITGSYDSVTKNGSEASVALTGSYASSCYGSGTMTLSANGSSYAEAYDVSASGDSVNLVRLNSSNTGPRGGGKAIKQNTGAFSLSEIAGDVAFGFSGATSGGGNVGVIGRFTLADDGSTSNGEMDMNVAGTTSAAMSLSGSIGAVNSSSGRATGTLTGTTTGGDTTYHVATYVIDANQAFWLTTDTPDATHALFGGTAYRQSGSSFTNASLDADSVFSLQGVSTSSTGNADVEVGNLAFDGSGAITAGQADENDGATLSSYSSVTGTYSVDAGGNGRGTMHLALSDTASRDLTFYLTDTNHAVVLDGTGSVSQTQTATGKIEERSGTTGGVFASDALDGIFTGGSVPQTTGYAVYFGESLQVSSESDILWMVANESFYDGSISQYVGGGAISLDPSSGRLEVPLEPGNTWVIYLVSPDEFYGFEMSTGQHQPSLSQFTRESR